MRPLFSSATPLLVLGLALVLLGGPASRTHAADTLTFEADPYMPYTGDSEKGETGFMVDIVKAVFEAKGYNVVYQSTSWNAVLHHAKEGRITGIVGLSKIDAPDLLFPKIEEGRAQGMFYVGIESDWKYAGAGSLDKIVLGIIADYKYNPEVGAYITKNRGDVKKIFPVLSDNSPLTALATALLDKRITTFVEDKNVVQYFLKSYDRADRLVEAGPLKASTDLYVAFSPLFLNAPELAAQLSEGVAAMRADGRLGKILAKYGVTDWATAAAAQ
ncbi:amino acid ABC transporter substrate-binding protein, PAAT family [Verrucomicrobium sp. GAS474]|uniref:substrate-binding periplasmic protein n=1 Tax=Verrucomicrobium sp. GAS474 TaxID=1882831 RepID=UPI000879A898|nr:transporter substrate-binding domain-containing protein [Verrucomicrobium sp. GAS474]SDT91469.1 amino acid ABC transporter substrate-binding protein, PAAT family [Verrucomicrobium sp. GAS474]